MLILQQPKYWCKHCNTYVRDTKLEKTNHEATPKHQGNLKRFLRDLHRGHEKDEKDKERAKAEVARLNGITAGDGAGPSSVATSSGLGRGPTPSLPKAQAQATPSQRKQQLAQLAEMGISIPDGFRPDLAMAGEWQVTSERVIEPEGEKKPEALALGVRKRAVEQDEEGEGGIEAKKRRWGSTYKTHPTQAEDEDLDALLSNVTQKDHAPVLKVESEDSKGGIKKEPDASDVTGHGAAEIPVSEENLGIKKEPSDGEILPPATLPPFGDGAKEEGEQNAPGVVFKKRKAKNIRQK
jgi:hypothetical protein